MRVVFLSPSYPPEMQQYTRGLAEVGATVFGEKASLTDTSYGAEGFRPMVEQVLTFFRTRRTPVPPEDTLEIIAFLEAADQSQRQQGARVDVRRLLAATAQSGRP